MVFTGAGVSAKSGLKTFRDMGGLWNECAIEDVASPEGWRRNPSAVLSFYNERRQGAEKAGPIAIDAEAINSALAEIGVQRLNHRDEFAALGLDKHRDTDDWLLK